MSKAASAAHIGNNAANPAAADDDIVNAKVGVSCLDFLLIELVPLAQRITERLHAREQALRDEVQRSKILYRQPTTSSSATTGGDARTTASGREDSSSVTGSATTTTTTSTTATTTAPQPSGGAGDNDGAMTVTTAATTIPGTNIPSDLGPTPLMDDDTREAVFWRLDQLGYRVGQGLVERLSANKPRPATSLDAIKFVCKDLWAAVWRKQIDNLKTNHRGVFVLTDARFGALSRMSVDQRAGPRAAEEALQRAQSYLYFPCGIIRGALAGLGIDVTVTAETAEIPVATFQLKTKGAKP